MPTKKASAVEEVVEEQEFLDEAESFDEVEFPDEAEDEPEDELESESEDETEASVQDESDAPVRLTGQELLDFYADRKSAGYGHAEIAFDAGYYTVTKNNQERVMMAQFNQAYLEAQGVETGGKSTGTGRSHAGLTRARVSGQGILLVSQLATRHVGAVEGSVFEVSYPGDGAILLSPTGEIKPVVPRKSKESAEQPGTPLLD